MQLEAYKRIFFDLEKVVNAVEKAEQRAMSKFGAYVRTRARSSLRRRKKPSQPGEPPSVHSQDDFATLKNILFGFEPSTRKTVVGMVRTNGRKTTAGPVPGVHEHGADVKRPGRGGKKYLARYPSRPTMAPALKAETPNFANLFRGEVK
jgi:hypothetical protein